MMARRGYEARCKYVKSVARGSEHSLHDLSYGDVVREKWYL